MLLVLNKIEKNKTKKKRNIKQINGNGKNVGNKQ